MKIVLCISSMSSWIVHHELSLELKASPFRCVQHVIVMQNKLMQ